ncbi:MAG TPA: hypothetical protein VGC55_07185, partial [Dokdonella sp.]
MITKNPSLHGGTRYFNRPGDLTSVGAPVGAGLRRGGILDPHRATIHGAGFRARARRLQRVAGIVNGVAAGQALRMRRP